MARQHDQEDYRRHEPAAAQALDYAGPGVGTPPPLTGACGQTRAERLALQVGHRLGVAALLLVLGAAGAIAADKAQHALALLAFVCAAPTVPAAVTALWHARRDGRRGGEALALLIFTGVVSLAAATILVQSTLGVFDR